MTYKFVPAKDRDLAVLVVFLLSLVVVYHLALALHGQGLFRAHHLGTALHYAATQIDLRHTIIVGFNAADTPTIQEFPVWQAATGLAFKLLGTWWGWGNVVSLVLFLPCLFPLFQIARMYLGQRGACWTLIFLLSQPLVFVMAGEAATDGLCLSVTIWFLYCGAKLVCEPGWKWLVPACAFGSLATVSKLPFFVAAGLALFLFLLWKFGPGAKRLLWLAAVGGVSAVIFLLWTRYTDAAQAAAVFPFVDLRVSRGSPMIFWYFGDWKYRLGAINWIKGGWRVLDALFGSFAMVGLAILALANRKGHLLARTICWGTLLTTAIFSHLILHHWHYYLMLAPAVAILCAEGMILLESKFSTERSWMSPMTLLVSVLIGLSLIQGLMGMRALTFDNYPAKMAEIIRQHTAETDKLVIIGGSWGGEELFRSNRRGLSAWNAQIFNDPANYAKLKSLGYNKLVMISQSPFDNAIQVVNPGQADIPRRFYRDLVTPLVKKWPTVFQTEDILIKEIP
jgi:hypothetical protein